MTCTLFAACEFSSAGSCTDFHHQAGEEGQWLQSHMAEFKNRAEKNGDEDFQQLLEEIENREDLKKLLK